MERRRFLSLTAAAAGASAASPLGAGGWGLGTGGGAEPRAARDGSRATSPAPLGDPPPPPRIEAKARMKVGCQRFGSDPKRFPYLLRCGVRHICASPAPTGPKGVWEADGVAKVRKAVEDAGLSADLMYLGVPTTVLTTGDARDETIAKICANIRAAGQGGIPALQYNLHVLTWRPRTEAVAGRGGATYGAWDLEKAEDSPRKMNLGPIGPDEMWKRITYFLEKVVPVAAEAKVRLACHPPDPPVPAENRWKIAQVLDTVAGLQKFVSICDSDYHGLNFCQGSICEMCQEPAKEIFDIIRWFGTRRKIVNVHFRNIRGRRDKFAETFPDEGDVDMFKAVQVYKEVGYTGMLMPDHAPGHPDDPEGLQAFAFAYGYIGGLIQAVGV